MYIEYILILAVIALSCVIAIFLAGRFDRLMDDEQ